jgi:uncharacterized protein YukE
MAEYITLLGSEQVQNAARQMQSAADRMQSAASSFEFQVERFLRGTAELSAAIDRLAETVQQVAPNK